MKSNLLSIFLFSVLFLASGCTQEAELTTYQPVNYEGEAYLKNYSTPRFLYQYEEKNSETGDLTGWVIDNEGNVRTYENVSTRLFDYNQPTILENFRDETQLSGKVEDVNELVSHYKMNDIVQKETLEVGSAAVSTPITKSFYAFALGNTQDDCESCGPKLDANQIYARFVLASEGNVLLTNRNANAVAMVNYLKRIHSSIGE